MRILIIVSEMITTTGSPMYNYTLGIELAKQGYEVDIYSIFANNEIRKGLVDNGVNPIGKIENKKYNLVLISQKKHSKLLNDIKCDVILNIVHSEYDVEKPIISSNIDGYIAIRPSIKEHLINRYNIPKNKIKIIYNGVDRNRFSLEKRKQHKGNFIKVVIPCTIDPLRDKFISYYENLANKNYRVEFYGKNHTNRIFKNKWVKHHDAVFDIENYICDADYVSGILLGRVNLEASSMGIPNYIHDPEDPENKLLYDIDHVEFDEKHNITNVVKQILTFYNEVPKKQLKTDEIDIKTQKIFTKKHNNNKNIKKGSICGPGSNLNQTKRIIKVLPEIFDKYNIKSMLDIPCGDMFWFKHVDLNNVDYIGGDIVDDLIQYCIKNNKDKKFQVLDIVNSNLPKTDLIFSRDCFVLLTNDQIIKSIKNIKKSGSKYLLTTSFIQHTNKNAHIGEWRPLNLMEHPFNLPKPIEIINENCTENNGEFKDKSLLLWEIDKL